MQVARRRGTAEGNEVKRQEDRRGAEGKALGTAQG